MMLVDTLNALVNYGVLKFEVKVEAREEGFRSKIRIVENMCDVKGRKIEEPKLQKENEGSERKV
jgi:hypothetical protein